VNINNRLQVPIRRSAPTQTPENQSECKTCQHEDFVTIGKEKPTAEKEAIIRSMVRQAPDCESVCDVVEALSAYPKEALERVRDFGTKLEVYDHDAGNDFPNYMPTLQHPQVVGAYNTAANVLGIEDDNLSPFVLLHEFAHALDASMGNASEQPHWKGAHKLASTTNQVIRDYAKHDPSEYLAENTAAFLVADDALYDLVGKGLEEGLATEGLSEREYMQMHQNFCNGRLERVDSNGYHMVDKFLDSVDEVPTIAPKPAMNEQQFGEWLKRRSA
jgi:hypothetical protein